MTMTLDEQLHRLMTSGQQQSESVLEQSKAVDLADWMQNAPETTLYDVLNVLSESNEDEWMTNVTSVSSVLVGMIRRQSDQSFELGKVLVPLGQTCRQLDQYPALQTLLMRLLISAQDEISLKSFAELVVSVAPLEPRFYVEIFGDLLRQEKTDTSVIFPTILAGLENPALASFVLDYANYVYRNGLVSEHPAQQRAKQLAALLSNLSERLRQLQDTPPTSEEETLQLGKRVTESLALAIALCDALACIGDPDAVASLNKALQVEHRRLRVEAAAALAKLGVEDAKKVLTAMAAEPIERLRVLAYAEELGLADDVEEEFSNIVARAEAEFVMYLAQPTQIGIAPQHIELIDQRELAWPGFEEPRNCFLFQFVYAFPDGEFTNIGITGPTVMTFDADLTVLTMDDIYALFAGWQVQHPDIFAIEMDRVVGDDSVRMERMLRSLTEADDFKDVTPVLMGTLLERRVLITAAKRNEENGWAMVSEDSVTWISMGNPERPLGSAEAFYLFVGRSLLKSFN